jgi:hypothetical protein|tara:strand:+ start:81 stop:476 length:396 start_codon:yes stop_codon:yes gene_type:complete
MAIVKGILVNDGGAPARIMNFEAAEAINAGDALEFNSAAKLIAADTDDVPPAGFALVDAASGDLVSMLTGSGIMIYANVDGDSVDVAIGDLLTIGESGALVKEASGADKNPCAVALEANAGTEALIKVLVF